MPDEKLYAEARRTTPSTFNAESRENFVSRPPSPGQRLHVANTDDATDLYTCARTGVGEKDWNGVLCIAPRWQNPLRFGHP
jgi:hypothetical protein